MQYKRNRYFDASSGRFTQEDPIVLAGGPNLYGYANGDPVNFSDPFGLLACDPPSACPVKYVSVSADLVFGAGYVVEAGFWGTEKQAGAFLKVGAGVGLDVDVGVNGCTASSLDAFRGGGSGGCGGIFVATGCKTENSSGTVTGGGVSSGPSEALPVSGHAEASYTFITSSRSTQMQSLPGTQRDATRVASPPKREPPTPMTVRSRP